MARKKPRKYNPHAPDRVVTTMRLRKTTLDAVSAVAKQRGTSRTRLVEEILSEGVGAPVTVAEPRPARGDQDVFE